VKKLLNNMNATEIHAIRVTLYKDKNK
jgi:hypothetical protein